MARFDFTDAALKDVLKEAVLEVLVEQPQLLQDVVEDALHDMALSEVIRETDSHEGKTSSLFLFQQPKGEA